MRPIFIIHAGEYLVGSKIEETFRGLDVWVPSKDTGIDLLVTDSEQNKLASLQVKFSKDHLATSKKEVSPEIKSGGWWKFNRTKLENSKADYWVMVLHEFQSHKSDFIVISPKDLLSRYKKIHGDVKTIQSYFWITKKGRCWETRRPDVDALKKIAEGEYKDKDRDFTQYLNKWPKRFGVAAKA